MFILQTTSCQSAQDQCQNDTKAHDMKHRIGLLVITLIGLACFANAQTTTAPQVPAAYEAVGKVIGKVGTFNPDGSYRINFPRSDVKFTNSKGMAIPADLGLATYIAFSSSGDKTLAVGDVAMLVGEIDRVIDALREVKFEVVSLHNHMTSENPRLFFVHFQRTGTVEEIARAFKSVLLRQKNPTESRPVRPDAKPAPDEVRKPILDQTALSAIFGVKPQAFPSGVVRFANPRKDISVTLGEDKFLPGMGLGSWAAFNACECGETMVMGDTACTRADLQNVIDALRKADIHITAIHGHILGGNTEVAFLHYEGEGDSLKLAEGIKACWNCLGAK
jgi:Domain of Unknown Function (DUF1259)